MDISPPDNTGFLASFQHFLSTRQEVEPGQGKPCVNQYQIYHSSGT